MKSMVFVLVCMWTAVSAVAQPRADATLRVTVIDATGAVIVGAHVRLTPGDLVADTSPRGEATFAGLAPGRYTLHVESPGFEPQDVRDARLRPGENRRDITLAIARLAETVRVQRDARERASDPRGDAFASILGQDAIDELPDDPDEMEQMLRDMAGPGAVLRVNGFRGGKLPPKGQIQQIRFRRNMFAADAHEPGVMSVDITTKPGLDNWRGTTTSGFRSSALNARNAFAPVKGDERRQRYGFTLTGPLWKQHTSLALSVDGADAFDSKTIVAALPGGYFADSVRRPDDRLNITARLEHALTKAQMFRLEAQRNRTTLGNLGVGDFDLVERGYGQARDEDVVRASLTGSIGKALSNELRVQWRSETIDDTPDSVAPAVLVLNAFDAGGAQLAGSRSARIVTASDDLDLARGRHAVRTGFQLDAGWYRTDERRNGTGTFTFASLSDYLAARPTTFTKSVGDPRIFVGQAQFGAYVQDDVRVRKDLTVSAGIRQEIQSKIGGLNLAPRGGVVWSPLKSGNTTVRAGAGVFFDWLDADTYRQAMQLDGTHQQVETIVAPGFPDPLAGGRALVLPAGRVEFSSRMTQPTLKEAMAGVEQALSATMRVNAMFIHRSGSHLLRGVNVNAPTADGTRPDPLSGPVTEIQSTAGSMADALNVGFNLARPQQRLFVSAMYMLSRSVDDADSAFSLPANTYDLAAERGPSAIDARHRFMSLANIPLSSHLRVGTSFRAQSALPYTVTTGRDDNGDTVSNDRPAGVTRNTARGSAQYDLGIRVSWNLSFGPPAAAPAGPQVRIVRGDNPDPLGSMGGVDGQAKRFGVEVFAQAYNALNHLNALNYSGVLTSPFFGRATSAAPPRRIEVGTRLTF